MITEPHTNSYSIGYDMMIGDNEQKPSARLFCSVVIISGDGGFIIVLH